VVLAQRLQPLWGGYGDLWRAELERGGRASSVIIKHVRPPKGDRSRSHQRKLRSYAVELAFYETQAQRCFELPSCRVPRLIFGEDQADGWILVLEDLAEAGFKDRSHWGELQIAAVLRWLATFHARFLGREGGATDLWKVGTYWHLGTRPDELAAMRHPALRKAAGAIDTRLNGARFKTLVHGDAKPENASFASSSGEAAFVDFQYVGGGVGVKDVAYFLNGVLSPRQYEKLVPVYLDDYFRELQSALAACGSGVDSQLLEQEWRALFDLAWVDFYRFLLGWAPGQFDGDAFSERLTQQVLNRLGR
jgi:hypothetical protein